jgi:hypothetical protein
MVKKPCKLKRFATVLFPVAIPPVKTIAFLNIQLN